MTPLNKLVHEQTHKHGFKYLLSGLALFMTISAFAQNAVSENTDSPYWVFSNTLFNVLLGVIVLLLIIIAVLGSVLKSVGEVTLSKEKQNNSTALHTVLILLFLSFSEYSVAQNAVANTTTSGYGGLPAGLFFLMLTIIVFEIVAMLVLITSIQLLIKKEQVVVAEKEEVSFFEKFNASVAVEEEGDIMLDHDYDGIKELDNDLPPWWKYGFYVSIVAAFAYVVHYHVFKTGDLQETEFKKSVAEAQLAKEEFAKSNANNVDENNVVLLTAAADIASGQKTFTEMCAACHGKAGQGGLGPNLTDDYWLHGGSLKDVFKSIKYGWPDKGMKAWQADLSPVQIHQIASFIKSIRGTNPEGAKDKQGDLYIEEGTTTSDSTATSDSLTVKADSIH